MPPAELPGTSPHEHALSGGVLGTADVTFMVLAVAAPMAVVVATMPLAFALGNGAGAAGTYLLAGIAMGLFALGYVRLLPHVRNAGAFYAIISIAFGRIAGLVSAYIALVSYVSLCAATLGALAYFGSDLAVRAGTSFHWGFLALGVIAVLALLSYYRIDFTAKILSVALACEVLAILILDGAILMSSRSGNAMAAFDPSVIFAPGLGVSAIYAFNSCIGFEATAIYKEEARSPEVSIPRATYIAIAMVCLFYVFTAWCFTAGAAPDVAKVAAADPGHFVFGLARAYIGPFGEELLSALVVTSAFAAVLGLFNNSARYVFALARDGVLPLALSRTRRSNGAPFAAGLPVIVILVLVVSGFAIVGLDPLLSLTTSLTGLGSVGLMALLSLTAFAIPAYFRGKGNISLTLIAPGLAGLMLVTGTVLSVTNYPVLTGSDSRLINSLPWLLVALAVAGLVQALWLRRHAPAIYVRIGSSRITES